jgi:hypothetical protein
MMSKQKKENRLGFRFPFETQQMYKYMYIYIDIDIDIYIYAVVSIYTVYIWKTEICFPWSANDKCLLF